MEIIIDPPIYDAHAVLKARVSTLFDAIKHGDDEHKLWLKEAIENHFNGLPVPTPRGGGNKEQQLKKANEEITALKAALKALA